MNADDLRALVARSIDAEQAPSPPPPDLLERARAVRGRRRLAVVGVAVTVVLTAAAVSVGSLRLAEDPVSPISDVAAGKDELAQGAEPCPAVLPSSYDAFDDALVGTLAAAVEEPRLAVADAAWICRYDSYEIARTLSRGNLYEWWRAERSRRLADGDLTAVESLVDEVGLPAGQEEVACPADLGPRWLLVTATGGDLTGIQVDGFGCHDVRLTGSPDGVAAGEPQDDGTVSGVLAGPDRFDDRLEELWTDSPEVGPAAEEELRALLPERGCEPSGAVLYPLLGRGGTPQEAVERLLDDVAPRQLPTSLLAPGTGSRFWLLTERGVPSTGVVVRPEGDDFIATTAVLCGH